MARFKLANEMLGNRYWKNEKDCVKIMWDENEILGTCIGGL